MFLIPVVPGIAVYLGAGVLIPPTCAESLDVGDGAELGPNATAVMGEEGELGSGDASGAMSDRGFFNSLALAAGLAYVMKIFAHVLQQKMFGEMLSGRVGIRAMVGVNSGAIKAIRFILSKPGISLAKASCLAPRPHSGGHDPRPDRVPPHPRPCSPRPAPPPPPRSLAQVSILCGGPDWPTSVLQLVQNGLHSV